MFSETAICNSVFASRQRTMFSGKFYAPAAAIRSVFRFWLNRYDRDSVFIDFESRLFRSPCVVRRMRVVWIS